MPEGSTASASCSRTNRRAARCSRLCRSGGPDRLAVEIEDLVDLRVPGVETLDLFVPCFAHPTTQLGIARQLLHRVGEPGDQTFARIWRDQDPAAVIDIFRGSAPIGRNYRQADGHRFEQDGAAALEQRWKNEAVLRYQ